jgi:hypothetical protein
LSSFVVAVLPVVVLVVGFVEVVVDDVVIVDVVDCDPVGVSFLAVVAVEVVVVVGLDMLPVGEHVAVDVVLAVVVVDLVHEVDNDQTLSLNDSSSSLSEALLEDDDGEDATDDNQAGAPVAPS